MTLPKWIFIAITLSFLLPSCSKTKKDYVVKMHLLSMKEEDLYDQKLAADVIFDSQELAIDSIKNESRKLFLKALNIHKNKKQPQKAIELYKASILIYPDAKTYYELGNALCDLDKKEYLKEAIKAFEVAEYLDFQPLANIKYNMACAYHMLFKKSGPSDENYLGLSLNTLSQAFDMGFRDTLLLKKDPRINDLVATQEYATLLIQMKSSKLFKSSTGLFGLYVRSFPLKNQPFEITQEQVEMKEYKTSVNYDFAEFIPEMENTSFDRDVSHDYFYVAKVGETSNYVALIYSSISFHGEEMQPVHTSLATYDTKGNMISKKIISCNCSAEKIKVCKIEDNRIAIQDYKRVWTFPIDQVGFDENLVKEYIPTTQAIFKIDENGKIQNEDVPMNYSDSVSLAHR